MLIINSLLIFSIFCFKIFFIFDDEDEEKKDGKNETDTDAAKEVKKEEKKN